MSDFAQEIVERIREIVGPGPVGLHEPVIDSEDFLAVQECLESGYVSSVGQWVTRFEEALCETTGAKHAVAVSSGTSALQVALRVAGVKAGDEVLVPALSFVATANAVTYLGAIAHFVDVSPDTLGVNSRLLAEYLSSNSEIRGEQLFNKQTGRIIKAIVPMHCFGHPVDIAPLQQIARDFRLAVIEDAAEGLGSYSGERHVGTFGRAGVLSFNGNKIVTTGGGGAILTDDDDFARRAKHLSTTAKVEHSWEFIHDEIGYNYRMPNLNAALGWAQLQRLGQFVEQKRNLANRYIEAFRDHPGVSVLTEPAGSRSNYWLNTLVLDRSHVSTRDEILGLAHSQELFLRPAWQLLPDLSPYRNHPSAPLAVARRMQPRVINLPSSAFHG